MKHPDTRPLIGVGAIVWRGEEVLMGQRLLADGGHCWQFPGGHLESGESVIECALREVSEETGLTVSDPQPAGYTDKPFTVAGNDYITLYVSVDWQQGEAEVKEPDRCGGWQWFHYRHLPAPLFEPISLYLHQHEDLLTACKCQGTP